jgi:hypothetical protein
MLAEIYSLGAILFALAAGVLAFLIALIVGLAAGEGGRAAVRGLEAGVLALVGGLLARSFTGLFIAIGGGDPGDGRLAGWFLFLWPGVVDTIAAIFGGQLLTQTPVLLWIALVVGAVAGFFDGLWRIHEWKGPGVLTFLADYTWGLAGTTQGALFHLVNFLWAEHPDERRNGVHRYKKGFRFKSGFAVTQGSVMSNMGSNGPGSALYIHESTHTLQNRVFGPLFTLSYLGWMGVMLIPGLIAGGTSGPGPAIGVERLCYFNNPWEAWAYGVGKGHGGPSRTSWGSLIWSDLAVGLACIPFYAAAVAVVALAIGLTWF